MRRLVTMGMGLALAACAYTGDRRWNVDMALLTRGNPSLAAQQDLVREKERHFPETLRACVAANDPDHLPDLDAGRGYPISDWHVGRAHDAVMACMRDQGWVATSTSRLSP
ncbi:hypothetical protein [Nitrospirillum pindoramense]|uniref:Lipoprotein n=1 Tax=Nitrospirillum amazonense TaxID=28077 RepID=A0A560GMJ7_9PROT|nr:hypothetical protein [Nitrospirillum amazonense]TWB35213.1 hypothetical protein FBZ90_12012 [Nitrospirillum amazonense]